MKSDDGKERFTIPNEPHTYPDELKEFQEQRTYIRSLQEWLTDV